MLSEYSTNNIFINVDAEGVVNDISDSRTSKRWVTSLEFENKFDGFLRRTFRSRLSPSFWCKQEGILVFDKMSMELEHC